MLLGAAVLFLPLTVGRAHASMAIRGISDPCPLKSDFTSVLARTWQRTMPVVNSMRMRRVKEESDLQLWSSPVGAIWMPRGGEREVAFDLAEQQRGIYRYEGIRVKPGDVVVDAGANIG